MYSLLLVDDEPHIIAGIRAAVNWDSYRISRLFDAEDFHDAVQKALEIQPDIAIVDVRIGDKWGYELVETLKRLGLSTNFIMISGYDKYEYIHLSLVAGAKDYLLKPIDYTELERILVKIITEELHGTITDPPIDYTRFDPILHKEYSQFSKLADRMLVMIHNEYDKNINLLSVAETFQMNSRYIGQIFLSETKMKFSEYLLTYRMYIAKRLIENSDAKISHIARQVGYRNVNYFYQHFKSYYKVSPSNLREKN